jgi:hypothetical protein
MLFSSLLIKNTAEFYESTIHKSDIIDNTTEFYESTIHKSNISTVGYTWEKGG